MTSHLTSLQYTPDSTVVVAIFKHVVQHYDSTPEAFDEEAVKRFAVEMYGDWEKFDIDREHAVRAMELPVSVMKLLLASDDVKVSMLWHAVLLGCSGGIGIMQCKNSLSAVMLRRCIAWL